MLAFMYMRARKVSTEKGASVPVPKYIYNKNLGEGGQDKKVCQVETANFMAR